MNERDAVLQYSMLFTLLRQELNISSLVDSITALRCDSTFTIGRSDGDLLVLDKTVSRVQLILKVGSNVPWADPVSLSSCVSRYSFFCPKLILFSIGCGIFNNILVKCRLLY
jgi:hypothetical protein